MSSFLHLFNVSFICFIFRCFVHVLFASCVQCFIHLFYVFFMCFFHFQFPFLVCGFWILHLFYLHFLSSNNPLRNSTNNKIPFFPFIFQKDFFGFILILCLYLLQTHFGISSFSHPDNALEVCGLLTPLHIVPEWYFLCQYANMSSDGQGISNKSCWQVPGLNDETVAAKPFKGMLLTVQRWIPGCFFLSFSQSIRIQRWKTTTPKEKT